MPDSIARIEGTRIIHRDGKHEEGSKREKGKSHHEESHDDCVDISEEARDRLSGKKRGNILEYLER